MKFLSKIHPRVLAGAIAALAANLATVGGALAASASWWEAALLILAADGPIIVAWSRRVDPTVGAVVGALEPVLEEKLREHVPAGPAVEATAPIPPLALAPPAEPVPPLALVSPTGNVINPN